jgi:hypothetical protein
MRGCWCGSWRGLGPRAAGDCRVQWADLLILFGITLFGFLGWGIFYWGGKWRWEGGKYDIRYSGMME